MTTSTLLTSQQSILVIIDLQGRLLDMAHRCELVKRASIRLLALAELFDVPTILTEQYPRGLGHTHPVIMDAYQQLSVPKILIEKNHFGCCGDASFMKALEGMRPDHKPQQTQIVVAGIEAHVCVMQTVLPLCEMGYQVHLCWEAISGRGAEYRRHALDRMQAAGGVITNHESVAFEWARTKDHPGFKGMNRLLRDGQLNG